MYLCTVPTPKAGVDLTHVSSSESEVDTSLPPSTASSARPPTEAGESSNMKRTRGRALDFIALHTGALARRLSCGSDLGSDLRSDRLPD